MVVRVIATSACALGALALEALPALAADKPENSTRDWDRQGSARYLDSREVWWEGWDHAKRDHGTMCVSCHTQVPFALARPALRKDLGQTAPNPQETAMLADIEKRVHMWSEVLPFYSDAQYGTGKEIESRNAESVLNAIILANYDTRAGHLNDTTRAAFAHAWAGQSKTGPDAGAWVWQNFDYTPWESKESQYYWAAQLAQTVSTAPGDYSRDPAIRENFALLAGFLRSHYDDQPLLNKVVLLSASARVPGLLTKAQREKLLGTLFALQRADGGWSLTDLGHWQRRDGTPLETHPDGYATGIVTLALEQNAIDDAHVKRGVAWLIENQDKTTGAWPAWSLNKDRDPKSEVGQFMSDAATGYAVLALEARR